VRAAQAWRDEWLAPAPRVAGALLWRGVEAQHRVAMLRLIDTLAEQAELERLLEASKPPLPPAAAGQHYLIATPFRYRSPHASRFRAANEPGVWYGAKAVRTACIEVAYWRWRFLMDSEGLRDGELVTEHTLFQARVRGRVIDLSREPWARAADAWTQRDDYRACQSLARAARAAGRVQWIRYASVRDAGGICAAVFEAACLALPEPLAMQSWVCKVTRGRALMLHDVDRIEVALDR
jgi:RES domain